MDIAAIAGLAPVIPVLTVQGPADGVPLARALARREKIPHLKLKMPLRPGRAPGLRKKRRLEIDEILHQCDWLARNTVASDTS